MIREYLRAHGAIGKHNALTTSQLMNGLQVDRRRLVAMVASERGNGALICSSTAGKGGYYLPATVEEIREQKEKLEKGIAIRANAVRPFRQYMQKWKARNEP